ncbi:hypothetical protein [Microbulbifer epialgicus]|uniref:Uncharacterized protein n=1 Tax=Microbulbifer epialgicus TaxID=393907 RepID=A0ABV4NZJ5_9GAMM
MKRLLIWLFKSPKKHQRRDLWLSLQLSNAGGQLLLQWGPHEPSQDRSPEGSRVE